MKEGDYEKAVSIVSDLIETAADNIWGDVISEAQELQPDLQELDSDPEEVVDHKYIQQTELASRLYSDAILFLARQIIAHRVFDNQPDGSIPEGKQWFGTISFDRNTFSYWMSSGFYADSNEALADFERSDLIPPDLDFITRDHALRIIHLIFEHAGNAGTTGPNEVKPR